MKNSMYVDGAIVCTTDFQDECFYDVANLKAMAQFDGCGSITRYSIADKWEVLCEESWYSGISINERPINDEVMKKVTMIGRNQIIELETQGLGITIVQFMDEKTNGVFVEYIFRNKTKSDATILLNFGFGIELNGYILNNYIEKKCFIPFNKNINIEGNVINIDLSSDYYFDIAFNKRVEITELKDERFYMVYNDVVKAMGESRFRFVVSAGTRNDSSFENVKDLILDFAKHYNESLDYINKLKSLISTEDQRLKAMFVSCMNCCLSSYKEVDETGFKGFFAGINYQKPARTYFRDGYWTIQVALPFYPSLVKNEILTLAKGVNCDGSCPSAVISSKEIKNFWSDHYDSPAFLIMMTYDYLCYTGDDNILNENIRGKKLIEVLKLCIDRLVDISDENNLIYKPKYCRRDWADNVCREGYVTYIEALYCRALYCMGNILGLIGNAESGKYLKLYEQSKESINKYLWNEKEGYYNDYISGGYCEDHLAIDSIITILYGIADEKKKRRILESCKKLLESRNNMKQKYGDWGVLCVYPFYKYKEHTVQKSNYEYKYHNGSDWPYLDGLYALINLLNNEDYEYALTRWFDYSVEQGWFTPVEYYSPAYGRGSNLQAWSSMPAAAMVMGGFNFIPDINGNVNISNKGMGCTFKNVYFRGNKIELK